MQPLKKFSPEGIRANAPKTNLDLQSIGVYSKSDTQHHIRKQQFQELLIKMDTIQRQSIDQNLRKLAETAGLSDIHAQDYSRDFKYIKDYIYLNGENFRPQDISPIKKFSFVNLKNKVIAFLGWPYYILGRLTILYARFNFIEFLFSLLKGISSTTIIRILSDSQIKEYNTKLSTTPNTYEDSQNNTNTTPTATQLQTKSIIIQYPYYHEILEI